MIRRHAVSKAPNFSLLDKESVLHSLDTIFSDFIVLYFYPKDSSAGCTIQAKDFTSKIDKFHDLGAHVIGISGLDEKSKMKFAAEHNLRHLLLADPDFKVAKSYKVFGKKQFMGKKYNGISRTTFILDKDKNILKVFENVKPEGHVEKVLDYLELLSN